MFSATSGALDWLIGPRVFASPESLRNASLETSIALWSGMRAMSPEEISAYEARYHRHLAEAHDRWLASRSAEIEARAPTLFREIDEAVARNKGKRGIWD